MKLNPLPYPDLYHCSHHQSVARKRQRARDGFARMELLASAVALVLLALVALPLLANTSARSDRVACLNNLRIVGRALQSWGQDHGDKTPWNTPYCEGGTWVPNSNPCAASPPAILTSGLQNNIWFQYWWLTNELASPKVLADPSDDRARPAQDWGSSPNGGFIHPNFRNRAVSYFIGLHAKRDFPESALSGDRNIQTFSGAGCSLGITPVASFASNPSVPPTSLWQNGPHGWSGNVLRYDGVVEQTDDDALYRKVFPAGSVDDNGSQHFMLPQ